MTRLPGIFAPILGAALLVAASACIGGDDPAPGSPAVDATGEGVLSEDTGNTDFAPGRFRYQFNSITAQAVFEGNVATLTVRNATGSELGAPALTVLGADDRRYEGVVQGSGPIADGEQVTLEFTFPETVTPQTVGLTVLTLGGDNVGAMAPVPVSEV